MNKSRRKQIDELIRKVEDLTLAVKILRDEEENAHDNLPAFLQETNSDNAMYEAIDALNDAIKEMDEATQRLLDAHS